jgi:hypothetical protein
VSFSIRVTGADLREVSRKLRKVSDAELKRRFRTELRAAAAPFVPAVRASIMSIPTTGGKSTGLRRRMSRAVMLRVKTAGRDAQVSILMSPARMPDGQRALPAYMEGTKAPWRHPVFGDDDAWVEQPSHPYFFRVVRPMGASAKLALTRVVNQISRDIT